MKFLRKTHWAAIIIAGMWFCMTALCLNAASTTVIPANPVVVIQTSLGDITVELYPDKAPKTVENFLSYVKEGHYRGTIFHRVISGFMIQGGGFTPSMTKKGTKPPIPNEAANGLKNERGTIAMARTTVVDSATAQFFINVKNNEGLNHTGKTPDKFGYAVFGKVIAGMEVVDKINAVATGSKGGLNDVPNKPVIIKAITIQ
jgi:cyclophilin family peptidyl-prolyl cis-trans isomerase